MDLQPPGAVGLQVVWGVGPGVGRGEVEANGSPTSRSGGTSSRLGSRSRSGPRRSGSKWISNLQERWDFKSFGESVPEWAEEKWKQMDLQPPGAVGLQVVWGVGPGVGRGEVE